MDFRDVIFVYTIFEFCPALYTSPFLLHCPRQRIFYFAYICALKAIILDNCYFVLVIFYCCCCWYFPLHMVVAYMYASGSHRQLDFGFCVDGPPVSQTASTFKTFYQQVFHTEPSLISVTHTKKVHSSAFLWPFVFMIIFNFQFSVVFDSKNTSPTSIRRTNKPIRSGLGSGDNSWCIIISWHN